VNVTVYNLHGDAAFLGRSWTSYGSPSFAGQSGGKKAAVYRELRQAPIIA